jgi:hypothetical protein
MQAGVQTDMPQVQTHRLRLEDIAMTSTPHTVSHIVDFPYTRAELDALFAMARTIGSDNDRWSAASACTIQVRAPQEQRAAGKGASTLVGNFYVNWITYTLQHIECAEGYDLADLLHELAILEQQALGCVKHGTAQAASQE